MADKLKYVVGILIIILVIVGISLVSYYVKPSASKCLVEGKGIPGGISTEAAAKYPSECCLGLSFVSNSNLYDKDCNKLEGSKMPVGGALSICTKCGDEKCGTGETKCNCPKDCK